MPLTWRPNIGTSWASRAQFIEILVFTYLNQLRRLGCVACFLNSHDFICHMSRWTMYDRILPCPKLYLLCCLQYHVVGQSIQRAELVFRTIKTQAENNGSPLFMGNSENLGSFWLIVNLFQCGFNMVSCNHCYYNLLKERHGGEWEGETGREIVDPAKTFWSEFW